MRPEKAYQVIHQAMESFFKELPLKERLSPLFSKKVKLALVCAFNAHYKEAKAFDKIQLSFSFFISSTFLTISDNLSFSSSIFLILFSSLRLKITKTNNNIKALIAKTI